MSYTYENEIKVLKEGDYEGVLGAYKTVSERTGVEYIRLEFKIRDDVEQEGKNRIIFDNIFQEKNEKGEPSGVYLKRQLKLHLIQLKMLLKKLMVLK